MDNLQFGHKILSRMADELKDVAMVERETKLEGRNLVIILGPK
jgi:translation initiation factor IF-3